MDAAALDAVFGTGFSSLKSVSFSYLLNTPASAIPDPNADVQEQQREVDITVVGGALTIAEKAGGDGLWIPYLGNGKAGIDKGWGTYTGLVGGKTWVATGKFSGCSIGMFSSGSNKRFAHSITPAAGYTAATVDAQVTAIKAATGMTDVVTYKPPTPAGEAIAFMLLLNGTWHKRIVQLAGGSQVAAINATSTPL